MKKKIFILFYFIIIISVLLISSCATTEEIFAKNIYESEKILIKYNDLLEEYKKVANYAEHSIFLNDLYSMYSRHIEFPIGTVIISALNPQEISRLFNENDSVDNHRKTWILADGSNVLDSKYYNLTKNERVPDLRAMFIRGMNAGRDDEYKDPDVERIMGEPQENLFASHNHGGGDHTHRYYAMLGSLNIASSKGPKTGSAHGEYTSLQSGEIINIEGGNENRPNNICMYYYIKIN